MSPRRMRWTAWGVIFAGAVAWGIAAILRSQFERGVWQSNVSYLVNVAGFLALLWGAVGEARVAAIYLEIWPAPARCRAILETVCGVAVALLSCVGLGIESGQSYWRAVMSVALALGIGVGLAGLFSLLWFYGMGWAATRMGNLDQSGVEEARRRLRDRQ